MKNIIVPMILFANVYLSQGQLVPLKTYFSRSATDNGCSTRESELNIWINERREFQRIEGLIFKTQQPGTKPLKRFWNANRNDNGMTARDFNSYLSQGYQDVGIEGYIYSSQQPGTIPLKSYYNQRDDDNHTSVLDADRDPAFKFVRIEGYIYPADYTTNPTLANGTYGGGTEKLVKLQLPGDITPKDYYVKQIGDKYILNGDIEIPITPLPNQTGIKTARLPGMGNVSIQSVTKDPQKFLFWTILAPLWNEGKIPIEIDKSVFSDPNNVNSVKSAIDYMNANTGLIFYPRINEGDYVTIKCIDSGLGGGSSSVGRIGGQQIVKLIDKNFSTFTVVHELMHAAGVLHEQSRQDRDKFINIDYANIIDDAQHNFEIEGNTSSHGEYDYCSIMHYPDNAFAKNPNKPTITCKNNNKATTCPECMGKQDGLTKLDIQGLDDYYRQIGVSRFPIGGSFPMMNKDDAIAKMTLYMNDRGQWGKDVLGNLIGDQGFPKMTSNGYNEYAWYWGTTKNNGFVFYMPLSNTVYSVSGATRSEMSRFNNEHDKRMGYPTSDPFSIKDGGVCQRFRGENGSSGTNIYWHPKYGAHAVIQTLFACYSKLTWENGVLGYPTDNERECGAGPGTYQSFERGIIYHKNGAAESFAVQHGLGFNYFSSHGWEGGIGFPVSPLQTSRKNNGVVQFYQKGWLFEKWGAPAAYFVKFGQIYDAYKGTDFEAGRLGYPVGDEYKTSEGLIAQDFENGKIIGNKVLFSAANPDRTLNLRVWLSGITQESYPSAGWTDVEVVNRFGISIGIKSLIEGRYDCNAASALNKTGTCRSFANNDYDLSTNKVWFNNISKEDRDGGYLRIWMWYKDGDYVYHCTQELRDGKEGNAPKAEHRYGIKYFDMPLRDVFKPSNEWQDWNTKDFNFYTDQHTPGRLGLRIASKFTD